MTTMRGATENGRATISEPPIYDTNLLLDHDAYTTDTSTHDVLAQPDARWAQTTRSMIIRTPNHGTTDSYWAWCKHDDTRNQWPWSLAPDWDEHDPGDHIWRRESESAQRWVTLLSYEEDTIMKRGVSTIKGMAKEEGGTMTKLLLERHRLWILIWP